MTEIYNQELHKECRSTESPGNDGGTFSYTPANNQRSGSLNTMPRITQVRVLVQITKSISHHRCCKGIQTNFPNDIIFFDETITQRYERTLNKLLYQTSCHGNLESNNNKNTSADFFPVVATRQISIEL